MISDHPFKPGEVYKVKENFLEITTVEKNKYGLYESFPIMPGQLVTVLSYKQDTSEWVSGGLKQFGIHHTVYVLYDNQIWSIHFSGNTNKLVKVKC